MRRRTAVLAVAAAAAAVGRRLRVAAGMRRGDQAVIDRKRARNKRITNRVVAVVGRPGHRHSVFAVLRCTGRRSGRQFSTPVRLVEGPDGFVIPLTYGPRTSWYRNLLAAPGELVWQGRTYPVGNPGLVDAVAVLPRFPLVSRLLLRLDGVTRFVRLEVLH
jgi:deazaflavin-dependent oxidoreductase (nitroreductase family)